MIDGLHSKFLSSGKRVEVPCKILGSAGAADVLVADAETGRLSIVPMMEVRVVVSSKEITE